MPFFRYTATDSTGKTVDGTTQAKDASVASSQLFSKGYQNVRFIDDKSSSEVVRSGRANDQDRMYMYTQAASLIRAGINPFDAFGTLAGRVTNASLQKACVAISNYAREGTGISKVMDRFVDLFPHNDVAMVRAGEIGGFLPEALDYLGQHYAESTTFKRRFWIFRMLGWQTYLTLVLMVPIPNAFWAGFHDGTAQMFFKSYVAQLLWPVLPIGAAIGALYYIMQWWLKLRSNVRLRHSLVLKLPLGIGMRARMESIRAFLWTFRNMSSGGVPPSTAWAISAASAPNADVAVRLSRAAGQMGSETRASIAFQASGLFPDEYGPMIQTAEQTGDMVGTLDRMVALANEGFEVGKLRTNAGLASLGCLLILLGTGALACYVAYGYYGRAVEEVGKYMDE